MGRSMSSIQSPNRAVPNVDFPTACWTGLAWTPVHDPAVGGAPHAGDEVVDHRNADHELADVENLDSKMHSFRWERSHLAPFQAVSFRMGLIPLGKQTHRLSEGPWLEAVLSGIEAQVRLRPHPPLDTSHRQNGKHTYTSNNT